MKTLTKLIMCALAVIALASSSVAQTLTVQYDNSPDDFSICASADSVVITGSLSPPNPQQCNYTYLWTTPDGMGQFSIPDTLVSSVTYFPDLNDNMVTIVLNATSTGVPCANSNLADTIIITVDPLPAVVIGMMDSETICEGNGLDILNTQTSNSTNLAWSSDLTGVNGFNNSSAANPTFTPTTTATHTLTVSANGIGECTSEMVSDSLILNIDMLPDVDISIDSQTICEGNLLEITQATGSNTSSLTWTSSVGGGTFSNSNTVLNPSFTPNSGSTLQHILTLTGIGAGECIDETDSDSLVLNITPQPQVDAGDDQTVCAAGNTVLINLSDATNSQNNGLTWSGGNGTFTSTTDPNPTYTANQDDIDAGSVTLTLTADGNSPCNSVSSEVTINFTTQPTIDSFSYDPFYCSNETALQVPAFTGTSGGTYDCNGCTLNANSGSFVPSAVGAGNYTVDYVIPPGGGCVSASASASFTINEAPLAEAGNYNFTTLCNVPDIELTGSSSFNSGVTWSSSVAGGSFSNINASTTSYTPPPNTEATVLFTLTSNGLPGCSNATDNVSFTLIPPPNAQLSSPPNFYCEGDTNFLQVDASPFNNAYSYLWNVDQIIGANNQSSVQFDPGAASQGSSVEITLTEFINDNTCQTSNTINVSLLFTPEICDYFELAGNILGVNVCETDDSEYFYQWGCGTTDFEGENENFLLYADYEDDCNGDYYAGVSLYEDGSCTVYAGADPTVSVSEEDMTQYLQLYPNPTSDILQLSWDFYTSESLALLIYDISGRLVFQSKLQAGERYRKISVGHLGAGNYRLALQSAERLVQQSFVITN